MTDDVATLLRSISHRLETLEAKLRSLEHFLPFPETLLAQRGLRVITQNPTDYLLLPTPPSEEYLEQYYRALRRYSFRLFLRDLIRYREDLTLEKLTHYCSPAKAQRYIEFVLQLGILRQEDGKLLYNGNPGVHSFGDILEWFVAQTLSREFRIPTLWGLSIYGLERGGDFDVVGALGSSLLYVETKSSPPKNIHMDVMEGFVRRLGDLMPDLAILLVDTHLRMEDKINKMVKAALGKDNRFQDPNPVSLSRGVFRLARGVYTCNSKPAIHKNLRTCLRHFHEESRRS